MSGPLGPAARRAGPQCSLRRGLALLRYFLAALVLGPGAPKVRPRPLSVPCPSALCVGARRSLCRGQALSVSGYAGALSIGRRRQRSLCRGLELSMSGLALSISGAGALCAGPRSSLNRGPALYLHRPGALCVGARRSLRQCRGLCVGAWRRCVRARHSACWEWYYLSTGDLSGSRKPPALTRGCRSCPPAHAFPFKNSNLGVLS